MGIKKTSIKNLSKIKRVFENLREFEEDEVNLKKIIWRHVNDNWIKTKNWIFQDKEKNFYRTGFTFFIEGDDPPNLVSKPKKEMSYFCLCDILILTGAAG